MNKNKDNCIVSNVNKDKNVGTNGISIFETCYVVMCTFFGVIPVGLFYGWAVLSYPIGSIIIITIYHYHHNYKYY